MGWVELQYFLDSLASIAITMGYKLWDQWESIAVLACSVEKMFLCNIIMYVP